MSLSFGKFEQATKRSVTVEPFAPGMVRARIGIYNTAAEIDTLTAALRHLSDRKREFQAQPLRFYRKRCLQHDKESWVEGAVASTYKKLLGRNTLSFLRSYILIIQRCGLVDDPRLSSSLYRLYWGVIQIVFHVDFRFFLFVNKVIVRYRILSRNCRITR